VPFEQIRELIKRAATDEAVLSALTENVQEAAALAGVTLTEAEAKYVTDVVRSPFKTDFNLPLFIAGLKEAMSRRDLEHLIDIIPPWGGRDDVSRERR
jgi:hypothetical protein